MKEVCVSRYVAREYMEQDIPVEGLESSGERPEVERVANQPTWMLKFPRVQGLRCGWSCPGAKEVTI